MVINDHHDHRPPDRRSATRWVLLLTIVVLSLTLTGWASAHTLGIDKSELADRGDGDYTLIAKVPPPLQPLITAPELPERCAIQGNPRGERGSYQVQFEFACATPLTSDDGLVLAWDREGTMLTVKWRDTEPVTRMASRSGGVIPVQLGDYLAPSGSIAAAAQRYTKLGIEHILEGIDHLLFVLALLLIVEGGWRLVKTITAFTIAHSITLALATLGYVSLPPAPVEASIALSIVFLCVEIMHARAGRPGLTVTYPWVVAFAFGLLHGLGFAGALAEIGLPPGEIPLALLFFNIGVEIGQLLFIAGVLSILYITRVLLGFARVGRIAPISEIAATYAIGTVATYWFIERAGTILIPA